MISSCGIIPLKRVEGPLKEEPTIVHSCNIRANIDSEFQDIVYAREDAGITTRVGVLPFFVPESFSNYGEDVSVAFKREMLRSQAFNIVEYFKHGNWQEHSEDFTTGNLLAINMARNAGYNTIVVGQIDGKSSGRRHRLDTKLIDVPSAITLWSGSLEITSSKPTTDSLSEFFNLKREVPNIFDFDGLAEEMARCAVHEGFLGKARN